MAYKVSKKKLSLFTTNFSLTYFILFIFLTVLMMFMDSRYDYLKQIRKDFSFITSPLIILTNDTLNYFENFQSLSKSKNLLGWTPSWNITNALEKTTEWYKAWTDNDDMGQFSINQIMEYQKNDQNSKK